MKKERKRRKKRKGNTKKKAKKVTKNRKNTGNIKNLQRKIKKSRNRWVKVAGIPAIQVVLLIDWLIDWLINIYLYYGNTRNFMYIKWFIHAFLPHYYYYYVIKLLFKLPLYRLHHYRFCHFLETFDWDLWNFKSQFTKIPRFLPLTKILSPFLNYNLFYCKRRKFPILIQNTQLSPYLLIKSR